MKVGLIARADRTGLSVQTWLFWRNMNPHRTLVVDLSYCSGRPADLTMFPGAEIWKTTTYPDTHIQPDEQLDAFLDDVDVVFTCETPYNYWLFQRAREKGVRTVLQYNYEFLEYFVAPDLPRPDLFAAPSPWNIEKVRRTLGRSMVEELPVPVDLEVMEQSGAMRRRTELNRVLHTVGNPAMEDRNGTGILLEATKLVRTPVEFHIRAQRRAHRMAAYRKANVSWDFRGTRDFWQQYSAEDDVYVMPRKFGGLCLPINEALGLGMPVLMSRCAPNSQWLPRDMLLPGRNGSRVKTRAMLTLFETNPALLAAKIDEWYRNPDLVEEASLWALEWAHEHSWDAMRDLYESTLEGT